MEQHKEAAQVIPFILDYVQIGIIAINRNGDVIICNSAAQKMTGLPGKVVGESIETLIPGIGLTGVVKSRQAEYGKDFSVGTKNYRINRSPITWDESVVGAVAIIKDSAELDDMSTELEGFIKINCSAIPGSLLESELFGYAPGAFTGAKKEEKPGLFELADEGTLFLDEIEDLQI